MSSTIPALFEPFTLPSGIVLRNRVLMAPMTMYGSPADGTVPEAHLPYYARRSKGVGAVITAATIISKQGGSAGLPFADSDHHIPALRRLAETIRQEGAAAILQIVHGGRKIVPDAGEPVSASAVAEEKEGALVPRALTEDEVRGVIRDFGETVRRAIAAGFDGVELHGANGYLIHQFFSPHSNRRTDRYGGSLEKRMTFALELIEEAKRVIREHAEGPFALGFRLSPEEPETPGITMDETLAFVDKLAEQGLDYLHISLNDYRSIPRRGVDDTRTRLAIIQARVGHLVPVVGVGSIRTADEAEDALQSGIPLLAVGRELVVDPEWTQKVAEGRGDDIRTTLSLHDRETLTIPESLWDLVLNVPGWFPLETKVDAEA